LIAFLTGLPIGSSAALTSSKGLPKEVVLFLTLYVAKGSVAWERQGGFRANGEAMRTALLAPFVLLLLHVAADDLDHDGQSHHLEGPDHDTHHGFMADLDAPPKRVYTMKCHVDAEFIDCDSKDHTPLRINGVRPADVTCSLTPLVRPQPLCDVAKMVGCRGYETMLEPEGKWHTMINSWKKFATEGKLNTMAKLDSEIFDWEHRAQDTLKTLHFAAEEPDATKEE